MWEYLTVFVLAATPLVELLVVIPLGIGLGLGPVPVALLAFAGSRASTWRPWPPWRWARRGGL
jgi:hypothetical protein